MRSTNGNEWIQFVSYLIAFRFISTRRQMRELFLCFGIRMYYTINTMSIDTDSLWRASPQSSIQMSLESCLAWLGTQHTIKGSQRAKDSGTTSGINCIRFISSWTCVKHDIYGIYSTFNCWQYKWCIKSNQVLLFEHRNLSIAPCHLGAYKTSEYKANMAKWICVW